MLAQLKRIGRIAQPLQDPVHAGANLERFSLLAFQRDLGLKLRDLCFFDAKLRFGGFNADLQPLLFDAQQLWPILPPSIWLE